MLIQIDGYGPEEDWILRQKICRESRPDSLTPRDAKLIIYLMIYF
jgi:hypothetical protein